MSRTFVFRAVTVMVLVSMVVLAACAPGAAPTSQVSDEATVAETPVEAAVEQGEEAAALAPAAKPSGKLLIWVQQANQDVFEQTIIEDFKQEYPDIEIEYVNYPPAEVANQMALAIQGGTGGPDLGVTENASIGRLVELGGLLDLTENLAPWKDQLNQPSLNESTRDGKNYCVPWDIGPVVFFYRRDVLKAAGLSDDPAEVSAAIATWDDFLGFCETVKDETGSPCFALNKANNYGDVYFNMLWQQGLGFWNDQGEVVIDAPENIATLEKLGEFWKSDLVSDQLEWTDGWYAELNATMDDPSVKPVAGVVIASWMGNFLKTWIAGDRSGDWGVAEMPAFTEGGLRSANQGGSCMFIPEDSANREAAWAFIEFALLQPENALKLFAYSDYFPALETIYDDAFFAEPDPYFGGQVTRQLFSKAGQAIPNANLYGPFAGTMRGAVATAVQRYAMGQASAADALAEAAASVRTETGMK